MTHTPATLAFLAEELHGMTLNSLRTIRGMTKMTLAATQSELGEMDAEFRRRGIDPETLPENLNEDPNVCVVCHRQIATRDGVCRDCLPPWHTEEPRWNTTKKGTK